jgi:hypothetical protein
MQTATGTIHREPLRTVAQAILIIAVALAGAAFGRWIIPAGDSSDGATASGTSTAHASVATAIAEHKFDSGTLEYVLFGEALVPPIGVPNSGVAAFAIAEHKFNSGALEAVLFGDFAVLGATTGPEAVSPAATIAQRKFDSGRLEEVLFGTS